MYKNRDYDSLKLALKELATLVLNLYRENTEFFERYASQLLEFAKKVAESGIQWLKTNGHLLWRVAVILVSSFTAFQIYHLYNSAKRELKRKERMLRSLYEDELKLILKYVNNTLLPNWENVNPDSFCEAAEHVTQMLDNLETRLKELTEEIRSIEENYHNQYVFYAVCGVVACLCVAVVAPKWGAILIVLFAVVWFLLIQIWVIPGLKELEDEAGRIHGMLAKSRTQIQLSMVEIKRTGKERKAESGEESSEEETK